MKHSQKILFTLLTLVLLVTLLPWCTTSAQAVDLTLQVDPDIAEGTVGHWYVNMPEKTGDWANGYHSLTLANADVTAFKLYDDGGKKAQYSVKYQETLVVTAPAGYLLRLSGNISVRNGDYFIVYDGVRAAGSSNPPTLFSTGGANIYGDIAPVISTGNSVSVYMREDGGGTGNLDLTVELIDPNAEYSVTVDNPDEGGAVTADPTAGKVNDPITLTAAPAEGYMLSSLSVKDSGGNDVPVSGCTWYSAEGTFKMPAGNVTVTPVFTDTLTYEYLSMKTPFSGTISYAVPANVESFKVYDDGGLNGYATVGANGTVSLTAPAGKRLKLTGTYQTNATFGELSVTADGSTVLNRVSNSNGASVGEIFGSTLSISFKSTYGSSTGLDLTVEVVDPAPQPISAADSMAHGTFTAGIDGEPATEALAGKTVTLTCAPEDGYLLSGLTVTDSSGSAVAVRGCTWYHTAGSFTMPGTAVTVAPVFTKCEDATDLSILLDGSMNDTDNQVVTYVNAAIPAGVQSFHIYDNGGPSGSANNSPKEILTITAPDDMLMKVSGTLALRYNYDYELGVDNSDYLIISDGSGKLGGEDGHHKSGSVNVTTRDKKLIINNDPARTNGNNIDLAVSVVDSYLPITTVPMTDAIQDPYYGLPTADSGVIPSRISRATLTYSGDGVKMKDGVPTAKASSTVTVSVSYPEEISKTNEFVLRVEVWSAAEQRKLFDADYCSIFDQTFTFTMPTQPVHIVAYARVAADDPQSQWTDVRETGVKISKSGRAETTIPAAYNMSAGFTVWDYSGGDDCGYSDGELILNAPTGYVFQIVASDDSYVNLPNSYSCLEIYDYTLNGYQRFDGDDEAYIIYGNGQKQLFASKTLTKRILLRFRSPSSEAEGVHMILKLANAPYKVTYVQNNGYGNFEKSYYHGAAVTSLDSPNDYTGHNFLGWYRSADFSGSPVTSIPDTQSEDMTLYAKWAPYTYTVCFDGNGSTGGSMEAQAHEYGTAKELPANSFTRTGYTFAGWNTVKNPTAENPGRSYADKARVKDLTNEDKATVTLYAQWTPINYYVRFNGNGNTGGSTENQEFTYDTAQSLSQNGYVRTYYSFAGWNTKANGTGTAYTDGESVKNLTDTSTTVFLYAQWTPDSFGITYNLNGGTLPEGAPTTYTYGAALDLPTPTRAGYDFAGWYDTKALTGSRVSRIESGSSGVREVWAKWTGHTYTVRFDGTAGSGSMDDQSFTCGEAKALNSNRFQRKGYHFQSWNTKADGTGASYGDNATIRSDLATEDGATVTLYAQWRANTYRVVFQGNGSTSGNMANQEFTYDEAQNLSDNAYVRAFTVTYDYGGATGGNTAATATATAEFLGWAEYFDSEPAYANGASVQNLTTVGTYWIYAKWKDASVTLPTPTKTGSFFGGWYSDKSFADDKRVGDGGASYQPTEDVTLYARWIDGSVSGSFTNGKLTATVTAPNGGLLIAAVYDASGRLAGIKACTLTASDTQQSVDTKLSVTMGHTYKIMLVDAATYAPLCKAWNEKKA